MTAVAQSSRRAAGIAEAEPTAPGAGWTAEFLGDVLRGLRKEPKELPCKYLYDERGSSLFDRICELEEYYPTRTELAIMRE